MKQVELFNNLSQIKDYQNQSKEKEQIIDINNSPL